MRVLSRLGKGRRGLSNLVAYVLLISITLALSVMVYGWLKFYVTPSDIEECPDGVNIIIKSYNCSLDVGLNVTLKNKGLFTVDGYVLKVHTRPGAEFGLYTLNESGVSMVPGAEHSELYIFSDFPDINDSVSLVEVQPFMVEKGKVSCKSYSLQEVECN